MKTSDSRPSPASGPGNGTRVRRRVWPIVVIAAVLAALLLGHGLLPRTLGLRLAVESSLPWLAVPILGLLAAAAVVRARTAWISAGVCALLWLLVFGPALLPPNAPDTERAEALVVVSQNLKAQNPDPSRTVRELLAKRPDVMVLEEFTDTLDEEAADALVSAAPYTARVGTIAVFSRHPITDIEPLSLGLPWKRALHGTLQSPTGPISLYALHAGSARPGDSANRDVMIDRLGELIAADPSPRIVAAGDFNASDSDSALDSLPSELHEPRQSSGGLGFTWPAAFPMTRPDHLFIKGLEATRMTVLATSGSDHRGILAALI